MRTQVPKMSTVSTVYRFHWVQCCMACRHDLVRIKDCSWPFLVVWVHYSCVLGGVTFSTSTGKPPSKATSDRWPSCLQWPLTLVPTALPCTNIHSRKTPELRPPFYKGQKFRSPMGAVIRGASHCAWREGVVASMASAWSLYPIFCIAQAGMLACLVKTVVLGRSKRHMTAGYQSFGNMITHVRQDSWLWPWDPDLCCVNHCYITGTLIYVV